MLARLYHSVIAETLTTASLVATLAAWQEQLESGLRILASLTAIGCALGGLYYARQKAHRSGGKKT